ncbi:MAG: hypothetical protein AAF197_05390 [Pseudomonadota bacterium]
MLKPSLIVAACLVLSACVNTQALYPQAGDYTKHHQDIFLVIDSLLLSKVSGADFGFNEEKNAQALDELENSIVLNLQEHGYSPTVIHTGNGLSLEPETDKTYKYSLDWKALDMPFKPLADSHSAWASEEVKDFFVGLIAKAEFDRKNRSDRDTKNEYTNQERGNVLIPPSLISQLEGDVLMFVKAEGRLFSLGTKIARGALGLAASGLLTGGRLYTFANSDIYTITTIVIDTRSGDIIWSKSLSGDEYSSVAITARNLVYDYPTKDGAYLTVSERKERKKLDFPVGVKKQNNYPTQGLKNRPSH